MIRILDDQGVGVGQVDARLDDGGAHQYVQLPVGHAAHHVVNGLLGHLPVGHTHGGLFPQQLLDAGRGAVDGVHPIVQIIYLAAPLQLPAHGIPQHPPVVLQHIGLHRLAVGGGLLQGGHVPDARQGHIQRPGDGGGRQGQHIHLTEVLLQLLLVLHAEALLLVHHQQPQVLELHVLVEQPVGADENVHFPVFHLPQGLLHLGWGAEAGDHVDVHRIFGKAAQGVEIVLPGQHGGGHQHRRLLAVQHALHHGPEGHLRLAIAHVAAQQPVHGGGALHVPLDLPDAPQLVVGLGVFKLLLKFPLPGGVGGEGIARLALPLGVQGDEPLGQVFYRLAGLALGLFPVAAPQTGELLCLVGVLSPADILADQVQLGGGNIEHVRPGVGELHIVPLHPVHGHLYHAHVAAHAVVLVNHQVTGGQVGIGLQLLPVGGIPLPPGPAHRRTAPLGDHRQLDLGIFHTGGQAAQGDDDLPRLWQVLQLKFHSGLHLLLPQQGLQL